MTNETVIRVLNLYAENVPAWWAKNGPTLEPGQDATILEAACSEFNSWSHDDNPPVWKPSVRRMLERLQLDPDAPAPMRPLRPEAANPFTDLRGRTVRQILEHTLHLIHMTKRSMEAPDDQASIYSCVGVIQTCLAFAGVYTLNELVLHANEPPPTNQV